MNDMEDVFQLHEKIEILETKLEIAMEEATRYRNRSKSLEEFMKRTGIEAQLEARGLIFETYDKVTPADIDLNGFFNTHTKGTHMELFEKLAKENPVVGDAWNKFMVSLRLTGYDDKPYV